MECPTVIWNTERDSKCDPRDVGYVTQMPSHWWRELNGSI